MLHLEVWDPHPPLLLQKELQWLSIQTGMSKFSLLKWKWLELNVTRWNLNIWCWIPPPLSIFCSSGRKQKGSDHFYDLCSGTIIPTLTHDRTESCLEQPHLEPLHLVDPNPIMKDISIDLSNLLEYFFWYTSPFSELSCDWRGRILLYLYKWLWFRRRNNS